MQDVHVKLNAELPWEKKVFNKKKEQTNKLPHLERGLVWCWKLETSESRSELPRKLLNVVLEKDGKDQLDRSCEK
jgi:hypothetical protein